MLANKGTVHTLIVELNSDTSKEATEFKIDMEPFGDMNAAFLT